MRQTTITIEVPEALRHKRYNTVVRHIRDVLVASATSKAREAATKLRGSTQSALDTCAFESLPWGPKMLPSPEAREILTAIHKALRHSHVQRGPQIVAALAGICALTGIEIGERS